MEKLRRIYFTVINDLTYDQRMIRICTALSNKGFDCTLIGRSLPNSVMLKQEVYKQKRLYCFFKSGKLFYIEYNIRLLIFLLFSRFDAICSIDLDTVLPGLAIAKIKNKKHVFDAHELFTDVPEVVNRKNVKKFWSWVQKRAFTKTDMAYTVGQAIADYFIQLYKVPVHVIMNVPLGNSKPPYSPDADKFILYQGALNAGRGLEALIMAMKEIPCRLVLVGDGDLRHQLHEIAIAEGVIDRIEFMGYVRPENLPAITAKAWIGMNVSENAGLSYYLSLNNKCFDYIHSGLPSLMNPFPEYIAINKQFEVGVLCEAIVSDIIKNANKLLTDINLHLKLQTGCKLAATEFTWEKEEEKLIKLYTNLFENE